MASDSSPILIVGAGAAGLMAAVELAEAGQPVVIVERSREAGRKILVSGGGRCNFTHQAPPEEFLARFPARATRFLKPAVFDLSPEVLREWFAARGLRSVVEPDGCVFPASGRSRDVLEVFWSALARAGVEVRTEVECDAVLCDRGRAAGVETSAGALPAAAVILAAGGPAWPQAGGSPSGLTLLAALGHTVTAPRPGLAPLHTDPQAISWVRDLQGVSLPRVQLTLAGPRAKTKAVADGPLVFAHFGLSGPAALDMSLHLDPSGCHGCAVQQPCPPVTEHGCKQRSRGTPAMEIAPAESVFTTIKLSVMPGRSVDQAEAELLAATTAQGQRRTVAWLAETLPKSAVQAIMAATAIPLETTLSQLKKPWRRALAELLVATPLAVRCAADWREAMVTVGGCALDEINPRTLESRRVAGLHVVGELLDVAGPTGGYNLHAAFATGRLAARACVAPA